VQIVQIIRQAMEALAYLHRSGYMHRDMKPENLLIFQETCKISDFGLAKKLGCPRNTDYVSTRWYRAPEMLLHCQSYTCSVDVFALGCIVAEIFLKRPLFPGNNEDDQLNRITEVLGTPFWPDGEILARRCGFKFKNSPGVILSDFICAPRQAIRLIELMIRWDPNSRITAAQALEHPFLAGGAVKKKLPIYPEEPRNFSKNSCKRFL
jgi:serine/threonine protein kinase